MGESNFNYFRQTNSTNGTSTVIVLSIQNRWQNELLVIAFKYKLHKHFRIWWPYWHKLKIWKHIQKAKEFLMARMNRRTTKSKKTHLDVHMWLLTQTNKSVNLSFKVRDENSGDCWATHGGIRVTGFADRAIHLELFSERLCCTTATPCCFFSSFFAPDRQ